MQLRQLHLELAFAGAGVAGEDVEDELGAVKDAGIEFAFQVALLRGVSSWSKMTRSGAVDATAPFSSSSLPLPISVAGSGLGRRCSISPAMSAPALVASSRSSAIDSSGGEATVLVIVDMEERRSCVASYAGAGRNLAGGSRTGRGRGRAGGWKILRARLGRRTRGELHSHQKGPFRMVAAGLPGAAIRYRGARSLRARNKLFLVTQTPRLRACVEAAVSAAGRESK